MLEITREAMRVADESGLAGLSMGRVAERLKVSTMALYRYVPGKGELIELMYDVAVGEALGLEVPGSSAEGESVRNELAVLARRIFAGYNRHRWMLEVPVSGPPLGPNNLLWLEGVLKALSGTGLEDYEGPSLALLLSGYVRGAAQVSVDLAQAEQRTGMKPEQWGSIYARLLTKVVPDERYPRLAEAVARGAFASSDGLPYDDFEFGLQRVLDGIEAFIEKRTAP